MNEKDLEKILNLNILEIAQELLGERIAKQKFSPNYKGLCPFHEEKKPSFYIKPKTNRFICYACNAMGGPFTLVYDLKENSQETMKYLLNKIDLKFDEKKDYDSEIKFLLCTENN